MDNTRLPMTNGVWFWSVLTALVAWGMVWRLRGAPAHGR
jgi:DHA1 family bicyclomycin/chloramphenicol resistance-like MFS transporter